MLTLGKKSCSVRFVCAVLLIAGSFMAVPAGGAGWQEFAVWPSANQQQLPDIYGSRIVWQQLVSQGQQTDWDIYLADITDPSQPGRYIVSDIVENQQNPVIFGNIVAWQDDYFGDWDIYIADITDPAVPVEKVLTPYTFDQSRPEISGDIVVWDDNTYGDYDMWGTDITDQNNLIPFTIMAAEGSSQFAAAIWRNIVVWEDDFISGAGDTDIYASDIWQKTNPQGFNVAAYNQPQRGVAISGDFVVWQQDFGGGDWDIWAADISDTAVPRRFWITDNTFSQEAADIDGNIVVWQDFRNGSDWDIWGYNIVTGEEFQITDEAHDQINPAISGDVVVWEDYRTGVPNIYAAILTGPQIARCEERPSADITGDCVVDMADFAALAGQWLDCGLDTAGLCL